MIKKVLQSVIRKSKNPEFSFDKAITNSILLSFVWRMSWSLLRGLKLVFFGKLPILLFLGRGVHLINVRNIQFGKNVYIGEYSFIDSLGKEPIMIGNSVRIGAFSRIITSVTFGNMGKGITIGDNVSIGEFSCIGGAGGLIIGEGTIIGSYLSTHPENHVFTDLETPIRLQGVTRKGIKVGKNCWLGAKVTILDGVSIGDNCIVAAGAVVTKTFLDNMVIGGVPAKVIKERIC